jgi:hypothetical protein
VVASLIAATGERIQTAGFRTRMSGPEVVTPNQITSYMNAIDANATAKAHMAQLTYHLYWDPNNVPRRNEVRNWANQWGITTAQTEWMEGWGVGLAQVLFLDLTEADVSAWEQFCLYFYNNLTWQGDYYHLLNNFSQFGLQYNAWFVRQFSRHIRPGDVRVEATSDDSRVKPVAFVRPDGRATVVLTNTSTSSIDVTVAGIPDGDYDRSQTYGSSLSSSHLGEDLPAVTAGGGSVSGLQMPGESVVTLVQRASTAVRAGQATTRRSAGPAAVTQYSLAGRQIGTSHSRLPGVHVLVRGPARARVVATTR